MTAGRSQALCISHACGVAFAQAGPCRTSFTVLAVLDRALDEGHSHREASSAIPARLWELVAVYGAKRMRTVPDDKPPIDMILSLAL